MERVLSPDERIKRAEELYERRKINVQARTNATVNVENRKKGKFARKLILQCVVCLIIYASFYWVKNMPNMVSQSIMYKISDILEYDINIKELYKTISGYFGKKEEAVAEENTIETGELIEETLSVTDDANEPNEKTETTEEIITPIIEEPVLLEETSSINEMAENAEYIKANYSFIKPLEGTITSRYGIRNPTVSTVPKYHTGIDIARDTGSKIIAAMEGTVELVSSIGDYGNHIKITNGEVTTLYAHCNKIYVSQGQKVTQGQEIGEVGATGNVTGPHLHFEIRRNNQYVDPDLVLQF